LKKLTLSKETLRVLNEENLSAVRGGDIAVNTYPRNSCVRCVYP